MHKDLLSKENIDMWYTVSSEVLDEHLIMGRPDAECAEAWGASPAAASPVRQVRVMPDRQPSSKK
jgi:hypothetical protein